MESFKISPLKWRFTMLEDCVSTPSTKEIEDTITAIMFSQNLKPMKASERAEIFAEKDREVLRGRIRRERGWIQCLNVDEEGVNHILASVVSGYEKVRVVIAENFVGEPYYRFLYDGEDLFGGCV